jgi:nucleoside-diphosphate-sugar epimerase
MQILVIGGSGDVGSLVLPGLAQYHTLRVFDLRPPADPTLAYIIGNVCDPIALQQAMEGCELVLYMAMGSKHDWGSLSSIVSSFDASVKGLYLALYLAHQAGISHAVYTSTMSIYHDCHHRRFPDEEITPDATDFYGLTKRFGEEVCRNATRTWGMSINALRLGLPTADAQWYEMARPGTPMIATSASDVVRALLAALAYRDNGFHPFIISGDYEHKIMNTSKAKRLLGWEPLARPLPQGQSEGLS